MTVKRKEGDDDSKVMLENRSKKGWREGSRRFDFEMSYE